MSDKAPDYVPPPRSSGAGIVIGILVAVFLLLVVCGVGLLGFGFVAYKAVEVQMPPPTPAVPQPAEKAQKIVPPSETETPEEPEIASPKK